MTPDAAGAPSPADPAPPSTDEEGNPLPTVNHAPIDGPTPPPGIGGGSGGGSQLEATLAAGIDSDLSGGQPGDPQHVVGTPLPTPVPGHTPAVDSTDIAPPDPGTTGVNAIIDADATSEGVQSTRTVHVGDTFRVAVVLAGIPPLSGQIGGIASLDFTAGYDRTKIVAPTLVGGSSTQRNPDLNTDALDGDAADWDCLPTPEGDLDDPGGIPDDGKPDTGQAFLSCFTSGHVAVAGGGDVTIAVITFQAVAAGTTTLSFEMFDAGDGVGFSVATCPGTSNGCGTATIDVKN